MDFSEIFGLIICLIIIVLLFILALVGLKDADKREKNKCDMYIAITKYLNERMKK